VIDRPRALVMTLALLVLAAGCDRRPDLRTHLGAIARDQGSDDVRIVLVAIEDLHTADIENALREYPGLRRPDVVRAAAWATGTGIEAVASALSGRPAIDHVRSPQRLRPAVEGFSFTTRGVSPSLRSRFGFEPIFGNEPGGHLLVHDGAIHAISPPRGPAINLVMLDADTELAALLVSVIHWADTMEPGWHVKLIGFPSAIEDPARDLYVPVYDWAPRGSGETVVVDAPQSLTTALWGTKEHAGFRWAAWPESRGTRGGVFATDGRLSVWSDLDGFVFAAEDTVGGTPAARVDLTTRLADELFGGSPRALIAVRGSETVDFVDLSVFGHQPLAGRIAPWALEDIDTVWEPNANSARFSLGAEDRGDGVVLDLGWPPFRFEARLTGEFAQGSWLGAAMYTGRSARSWGFRAIQVEPFSRAFWLASAGGWPEMAAGWWPDAPVGVHVLIDGKADTPVPALLDEALR